MLTVKEGAATITRHYDALNRVTNYINAAGQSIRYTYDAASNLTSLRYPDGKTVTYAYDAHNRLSTVTDWASRVTSFTYGLNGRLTRMDRPNGTRRELSYDGAGQVREIAEKKANGRLIALFRLDYDAGGRPSYEFTVPKPQTWALPELDATADADNRLAVVNGQSVTHDPDGNMTAGFLSQGSNAAMVAASFGYDARNRLTSVSVGSTNVSYAYDAEGHRTRITVGAVTNNYTINPHAPLSQVLVAEAGGAQTFCVHGAGLLYEVQPSGAVRYYHCDLRGSTVAMTDESGTVTDRFEHSPYGTLTHREGTTQTPFGYNGAFGVMTDASGLLHMRARFYNPGLRRFVNGGPSGFRGGMNWYAYANGNPVNLADPFGLEAVGTTSPSWIAGSGYQIGGTPPYSMVGNVPMLGGTPVYSDPEHMSEIAVGSMLAAPDVALSLTVAGPAIRVAGSVARSINVSRSIAVNPAGQAYWRAGTVMNGVRVGGDYVSHAVVRQSAEFQVARFVDSGSRATMNFTARVQASQTVASSLRAASGGAFFLAIDNRLNNHGMDPFPPGVEIAGSFIDEAWAAGDFVGLQLQAVQNHWYFSEGVVPPGSR